MDIKSRRLIEVFSEIEDPRISRHRKHKLVDILVMSFCGIFSGHQSWYEIAIYAKYKEEFFRGFLELPNGIPSHDTFNRVFQLLRFGDIKMVFLDWLREFQSGSLGVVSIDGKFLTGSNRRTGNSRSALGMVTAYATESGICLASEMTRLAKDEGEKKTMEKVIESLELKGAVVTMDAAGATPTIVTKVRLQKGDYLIGLKTNQKALFTMAQSMFRGASSLIVECFETSEKGHGREERRKYEFINLDQEFPPFAKGMLIQKKKWKGLSGVIRVTSSVVRSGKSSDQVRYYFTSCKLGIAELAHAIRSHWQIENNLHWVLDVHFKEDHCRTRSGYADANLALMRRMIVSLIKKVKPDKLAIKHAMIGYNLKDKLMLEMLRTVPF